ncbi:MAG: hypothetical protein AB7F50_10090 [Fimbriimonadaceae bacterium]
MSTSLSRGCRGFESLTAHQLWRVAVHGHLLDLVRDCFTRSLTGAALLTAIAGGGNGRLSDVRRAARSTDFDAADGSMHGDEVSR